MPIAQNSHAIINAGFLFRFDGQQKVESASIVYGGISPKFVHPTKTETFLNGKKLFDDNVLQKAYGLLDEELVINYDDETPHFPSAYLKGLSVALFYKVILIRKIGKLKIMGQPILTPTEVGRNQGLFSDVTSEIPMNDFRQNNKPKLEYYCIFGLLANF